MEPVAVLAASKKHASGLSFSPDGRHLVTGGMEGRLTVWTVRTWQETMNVDGHAASVNVIDWCGDRAVTAGSDRKVRLWRLPDWTEDACIAGYVDAAAGADVLYLRKDRGDRVYRHDPAAGRVTAAVATGLKRLTGIWSLPGAVAVGGAGAELQVRDPVDLSLLHALEGHGGVTSVSVRADGKVAAVADAMGIVHLWDLADGSCIQRMPLGDKGYFFACITPDGTHLATSGNGTISWHTIDGQTQWRHAPGPKGVYGLTVGPDGQWLANAAADGNVRVFALRD